MARIPQIRAVFELHVLFCNFALPVVLAVVWWMNNGGWLEREFNLIAAFFLAAAVSLYIGIVLLIWHLRRIALLCSKTFAEDSAGDSFDYLASGESEVVGVFEVRHLLSSVNMLRSMSHAILILCLVGLPVLFARFNPLVLAAMAAVVIVNLAIRAYWYWVLPAWLRTVAVSPEGIECSGFTSRILFSWSNSKFIIVSDSDTAYISIEQEVFPYKKRIVCMRYSDLTKVLKSVEAYRSKCASSDCFQDDSHPSPAS